MGIAKLCVVQLSSSMKLAALAFAALAVMAVAVDVSENIHELDDDLAMVEVMHGAGGACDTEIRAAKAKCGERLAYFKKIHESSCGDKDLARVMGRIKRNHAKTKKQQAQLKAAENALRSGKYKEKNVSQLARAARERLLKAMVTQIHQKNALKSSTQLAINELKDEKSTRAKAHKATVKAVKLAKTSKDMAPVNTQAGKAKALYNKMVEEKVKEGRQKYGMKKKPKVTDAMIKKLFEKAKKARAKEQAKLKKVKKETVKVAAENVKLSKKEKKTAVMEKDASKKEKANLKKNISRVKKVAEAQKNVKTAGADATAAKNEVNKLKGMDLKALLAQAGNILKP